MLGWNDPGTRRRLIAAFSVGLLVLVASLAMVRWMLIEMNRAPRVQQALSVVAEPVAWIWAGGARPDGFEIRFALVDPGTEVQLHVSRTPDLAEARRFPAERVADPRSKLAVYRVSVRGLPAAGRWHYAVEAGGELDRPKAGTVNLPEESAHSFRFAFSNCARTGSNSRIFDRIREQGPDLFLHLGDLHYGNIGEDEGEDSESVYWDHYAWVLRTPKQARLYRSTSVAYVWDDHDFTGNNAHGGSPGSRAAQRVFRRAVPHHPLAHDAVDAQQGPIHREFQYGRCRFLICDLRSNRTPLGTPQDRHTYLGAEQKAWLMQRLEAAARDEVPLLFLVSTAPWIAAEDPGADDWGGCAAERAEIATRIESLGLIPRTILLGGDAHMLAADDGRSNRYGRGGQVGFPVLHGAPLDKNPSIKGGPYDLGISAQTGQYGWLEVEDDGVQIQVRFSGRDSEGEEILGHSFAIGAR